MVTNPITAKLRLRLALIVALPEPIMLERLRRLSVADLIVFRRRYGIRECRCTGRCKVQQLMLAEGRAARAGRSRRLAARLMRELRNDPPSMYQTRCRCAACRQAIPPIPFSVHQFLAKLLAPGVETAHGHRERGRIGSAGRYCARRSVPRTPQAHGCTPAGFFVARRFRRKFLRHSPDRRRGARMEGRFRPGPTWARALLFLA